jgi:hypothetical protein
VPREVFVSNTLHSVFFILQCQAFTRLTWDENAAAMPGAMNEVAEATKATPPPLYDGIDEWHDGSGNQSLDEATATASRRNPYFRSSET